MIQFSELKDLLCCNPEDYCRANKISSTACLKIKKQQQKTTIQNKNFLFKLILVLPRKKNKYMQKNNMKTEKAW